MSTGRRHGNKEAKKPKRVPVPTKPSTPDGIAFPRGLTVPPRLK